MGATGATLPTTPEFYNPAFNATSLTGSGGLTGTIGVFATYGFNLNFIGAALFPQIQTTFTALQTSLLNMDASNPAALLQVQLTMSEYENAVQSTSSIYSSWQTLIKAIIQNI